MPNYRTEEDALKYINEQLKLYPELCHASNIKTKLGKTFKSPKKIPALNELSKRYAYYLEKQLSLHGWSDEIIEKRVALLNDYYLYHDNCAEYDFNELFTSQSKLRSTILEEFVYLLFKDFVIHIKTTNRDSEDVIGSGAAKAYTNLFFSPANITSFIKQPAIKINVKDQDFVIYRSFDPNEVLAKGTIAIDDGKSKESKSKIIETSVPPAEVSEEAFDISSIKKRSKKAEAERLKVPILAVEIKTYLDKTMLEGVIATAEKLKMGSPYAHSVVVAESYQVSLDVDPAYSQIDQIYVLRKMGKMEVTDKNKKPVDAEVVKLFVFDSIKHIENTWSDVKTKFETKGIII